MAIKKEDLTEYADMLTDKQIKRLGRQMKRQAKQNVYSIDSGSETTKAKPRKLIDPVEGKTEKQKDLINSIRNNPQTVVFGPAGTGKTYVTASLAAEMLIEEEVDYIVLTRPNVPVGRSLGFLPGDMQEKFSYWLAPVISVLKEKLGEGQYEMFLKNGKIQFVPFEVIQGMSFDSAFIILDESQNTNIAEMKSFLTRQGEDCKVVINGDVAQKCIREHSGLEMVLNAVSKKDYIQSEIGVVEFEFCDVVRSGIVAKWLQYFDEENI